MRERVIDLRLFVVQRFRWIENRDRFARQNADHAVAGGKVKDVVDGRIRIGLQRLLIVADDVVQELGERLPRIGGQELLDSAANDRMLGLRAVDIDGPELMHRHVLDGAAGKDRPDVRAQLLRGKCLEALVEHLVRQPGRGVERETARGDRHLRPELMIVARERLIPFQDALQAHLIVLGSGLRAIDRDVVPMAAAGGLEACGIDEAAPAGDPIDRIVLGR